MDISVSETGRPVATYEPQEDSTDPKRPGRGRIIVCRTASGGVPMTAALCAHRHLAPFSAVRVANAKLMTTLPSSSRL